MMNRSTGASDDEAVHSSLRTAGVPRLNPFQTRIADDTAIEAHLCGAITTRDQAARAAACPTEQFVSSAPVTI